MRVGRMLRPPFLGGKGVVVLCALFLVLLAAFACAPNNVQVADPNLGLVAGSPIPTTTYGPCVTPSVEYREDDGSWWITRCGPVFGGVVSLVVDERVITPVRLPGTPVPNYPYCANHGYDYQAADLAVWPCHYPDKNLTPVEIHGDLYADINGNRLYQLPVPSATITATVTPGA